MPISPHQQDWENFFPNIPKNTAIEAACRDLARDLEKVLESLGRNPLTFHLKIDPSAGLGSECFRVTCDPGAVDVLVVGNDVRGVIYGVYEFSKVVLGVQPFHFWLNQEPEAKDTLSFPEGLLLTCQPPAFPIRSWFINDEDFLAGWNYSEKWDAVYEALLRLRGNSIAAGTFVFPDEGHIVEAAQRGLIISQHHQQPVGFNNYCWPEDVVFSPTKELPRLAATWRNCIRQQTAPEVIWSVGLRQVRHNDGPFWNSDPYAPEDDSGRGAVIEAAMNAQIEAVKAERGDGEMFITTFWHEGVELVHAGHLRLPEGVVRIWSDDGFGKLRDNGKIAAGDGVYYHTAYMNGHANHLTEMVPPDRIRAELTRALAARANLYFQVNVANVRPVPLTTEWTMRVAWEGDRAESPGEFLSDWASRYYGPSLGSKLAPLYADYFSTQLRAGEFGYWDLGSPKRSPEDAERHHADRIIGDHAYLTLIVQLATVAIKGGLNGKSRDWGLRVPVDNRDFGEFLPRFHATLSAKVADWDALLAEIRALAPEVPPQAEWAFDHHLKGQVTFIRELVAALNFTVAAMIHLRLQEMAEAESSVSAGQIALEKAWRILETSATGRWESFFRADPYGFASVTRARRALQRLRSFIDGEAVPEVAPDAPALIQYDWMLAQQPARVLEVCNPE